MWDDLLEKDLRIFITMLNSSGDSRRVHTCYLSFNECVDLLSMAPGFLSCVSL